MDNKFIPYASRKFVIDQINSPKLSTVLEDINTGDMYKVFIRDGKLISMLIYTSLEYVGPPIDVVDGGRMNLNGLAINKVYADGSTEAFNDYENMQMIGEPYIDSSMEEVIDEYTFIDIIYHITIPINVTPFDPEVELIDFQYTDNENGTYTITDWKGTLNGELSTKIIIPDNTHIIL